MSSEEEARERLLIAISLFTRGMSQEEFGRTYPKQAAEILASLDNYRTAIERRVLAQQPCFVYYEYEGDETCETEIADMKRRELELDIEYAERDKRCPSCTARAAQPQETSG